MSSSIEEESEDSFEEKKKSTLLKKKRQRKNQKEEKSIKNNNKRKKAKKEKEKNIEEPKKLIKPEKILYFRNLTKDSRSYYSFDNTFCLFKSIDDIYYLIYSNKNIIISYNMIDNKKMHVIKGSSKDNEYITNFRHHLDINNKRDLLISISAWGNNIKLWDISNWECLCKIKKINKTGYLYSACFLNDNNDIYIITVNFKKNDFYSDYAEPIRVYDLKGNKIKSINDSKQNAFSIESYYDDNIYTNYIITGNRSCVKSYDYNENKLYHIYSENNSNIAENHYCAIIYNKDKKLKLIESCTYGYIRIWNFDSGKLIKKIKINKGEKLFGICLWDENNIFVGSEKHIIKLIDIKSGKIKDLIGHKNHVITIKKFIHPKYGESLISQGYSTDQIKLFTSIKIKPFK